MTTRTVDIVTEAFERIGFDPIDITARHLVSAQRSLAFLLDGQSSVYNNIFAVKDFTQALSKGVQTFTLDADTIDIVSAVLRDTDNVDTPLNPMGFNEWMGLTTKTIEGRPDRYYVDRQLTSNNTKTVYIWQVPDKDNRYTFVAKVMTYLSEVTNIGDTVPVPRYWYDSLAASLATRLAIKYTPDRLSYLNPLERKAIKMARMSNSENAQVTFTLSRGGR